jgi:hypothetical protein
MLVLICKRSGEVPSATNRIMCNSSHTCMMMELQLHLHGRGMHQAPMSACMHACTWQAITAACKAMCTMATADLPSCLMGSWGDCHEQQHAMLHAFDPSDRCRELTW